MRISFKTYDAHDSIASANAAVARDMVSRAARYAAHLDSS